MLEFLLSSASLIKTFIILNTCFALNFLGLRKKASNFFSDCCNATTKFLEAKEDKQFKFLRRITSNVLLDNRKLVVTHQFPFNYLVNLNRIQFGSPAWIRTTNLFVTSTLLLPEVLDYLMTLVISNLRS